ncbi:hypothetical protein TNCV_2169081 [Trichonephila clavipes]|nr:hypothetical protein TNCV_2169081 [Trichonephila clavipes]
MDSWLACHEFEPGELRTRRVDKGRCTLNPSRLERPQERGASSGVVHATRPWFKITWSVAKSPRVAEQCDVNIQSIDRSDSIKAPQHQSPNTTVWDGGTLRVPVSQ